MINAIQQRRKPAQRAFQGHLVGRPYEPEEPVASAPVLDASVDFAYDSKVYETEIRKALGQSFLSGLRQTDEGRKDYDDLEQEIHIELWGAIKKYGGRMNERLAYRIARNRVAKFVDKRVRLPKSKLLSIDEKSTPENDELELSYAERLLAQENAEGVKTWQEFSEQSISIQGNPGSWMKALQERGGMSALESLVGGYYGTKKLVAEAMLSDPDMGVRDLPGIPRSTVSRVRQVILKDFENFLRDREPNRALARRLIEFLKDKKLTVIDALALPIEQQQTIKRDFYLSDFYLENKEDTN